MWNLERGTVYERIAAARSLAFLAVPEDLAGVLQDAFRTGVRQYQMEMDRPLGSHDPALHLRLVQEVALACSAHGAEMPMTEVYLLSYFDPRVRVEAAARLRLDGDTRVELLPFLAAALADSQREVVREVLVTLAQLDDRGLLVLPLLAQMEGSLDRELSMLAQNAGHNIRSRLSDQAKLLDGFAESIGEFAPSDELVSRSCSGVPFLGELLRWNNSHPGIQAQQLASIRILRRLGPLAIPVVRELLEVVRWAPEELAGESLQAIAAMGPDVLDEQPDLRVLLEDVLASGRNFQSDLVEEMFEVWAGLAVSSAETVADLAVLLEDEYPHVRLRAIRRLGELGPSALDARDALKKALVAGHPSQVRVEMIERNGNGGAILASVNLEDEIHIAAASCLLGLGVQDPDLLDLALSMLDSESRLVRLESIEVLGSLGTKAEKAIPRLEQLSGHDDARIAERARRALQRIRGR